MIMLPGLNASLGREWELIQKIDIGVRLQNVIKQSFFTFSLSGHCKQLSTPLVSVSVDCQHGLKKTSLMLVAANLQARKSLPGKWCLFVVVFPIATTVFSHHRKNKIWTGTVFCRTNTTVVSIKSEKELFGPGLSKKLIVEEKKKWIFHHITK